MPSLTSGFVRFPTAKTLDFTSPIMHRFDHRASIVEIMVTGINSCDKQLIVKA